MDELLLEIGDKLFEYAGELFELSDTGGTIKQRLIWIANELGGAN